MSTIEDFKNAPVGATATRDLRNWVMKANNGEPRWIIRTGLYMDNEEIERQGYTLDPTVPATAREALDLAWDLAHEVKEGQVIPKGAQYLEYYSSGMEEYTAGCDFKITPALVPLVRTLEPLPEPEPDWLDAPAVLAHCGHCSHGDYGPQITLHGPAFNRQKWECAECQTTTDWGALSQVTPLYPKEGEEK